MLKTLFILGIVFLMFQQSNAQNLGLHVTKAELDLWRVRSQQGPYRVNGDVSTNSPGDWARILKDKDRFMANPGNSLWNGISGSGCVKPVIEKPGITGPKYREMTYWVSAAFYGLIKNDAHVLNTAKKQFLLQVTKPNLQPSNKSRWCNYTLADGHPSFTISYWLTQLLYIYEYMEIGGIKFSSSEKAMIDKWFKDWGNFFQKDVDHYINSMFSNRNSTTHVEQLIHKALKYEQEPAYHGGPKTTQPQRMYNNRKATQIRFVGLVGVKYGISSHVVSYKKFTKEFLAFACYPNGAFAEFHRGDHGLPDRGFAYLGSTLSALITVADALARRGDKEIYYYETTHGLYGTQGNTKKSLKWAMQSYMKLVDGTNKFYRYSNPSTIIDGKHTPSKWYSAHECLLIQASTFYKDNYSQSVIERKSSKVGPYPASPAGFGAFAIWNGDAGTFPGVMFMFNHNLNIFGGSQPAQPVAIAPPPVSGGKLAAPSELRVTSVTGTDIRLSWKDNSSDETGFILEVSNSSNGGFTKLRDLSANATSYAHTGMPIGTTKYYRIMAKNSDGTSDYSNVVKGSTNFMPPTGPTSLTASRVSSSEVLLKWNDRTVIETGYVVEVSSKSNTGFTVLKQLGVNSNSFSHKGVKSGNRYYYRVKAINQAGSSHYSNTAGVLVTNATASNARMSATGIASNQIELSWDEIPGNFSNISIEYSTDSTDFKVLEEITDGSNQLVHSGLNPNQKFYYRIKAVDAKGNIFQSVITKGNSLCKSVKPMVNMKGSSGWCDNTGTELSAPEGFVEYEWKHGEASGTITADIPGNYAVRVKDQFGCWSDYSDEVVIKSSPERPEIISEGDSLYTNVAVEHQWFLNNKPIKGANRNYYIPTKEGEYNVVVTKNGGCLERSGSVKVGNITRNILNTFPNPNNGAFSVTIENPVFEEYQLAVYNSVNETVYQTTLSNFDDQLISYDLDLRQFGRGIYFVKVYHPEGEPMVKKVLIN